MFLLLAQIFRTGSSKDIIHDGMKEVKHADFRLYVCTQDLLLEVREESDLGDNLDYDFEEYLEESNLKHDLKVDLEEVDHELKGDPEENQCHIGGPGREHAAQA